MHVQVTQPFSLMPLLANFKLTRHVKLLVVPLLNSCTYLAYREPENIKNSIIEQGPGKRQPQIWQGRPGWV